MIAKLDNGVVVGVITELPANYENISGFNLLSAMEAAAHGFYEMVETKDTPTEAQRLGTVVDTLDGITLRRHYPAIDIPAEELAADLVRKNESRAAQIKVELAALDLKKIRPLAEGDVAYLSVLNQQTLALRDELKAL